MPRLFALFCGLLHSLSGLYVVMNRAGALMAIGITPGNTDDRAALVEMVAGLEGKLLADTGHGAGDEPLPLANPQEACTNAP